MDNIEELKNRIETYEEESPDASLAGLIEELSLVSAIDALDETVDAVSLMTLHSAKGIGVSHCIFGGYGGWPVPQLYEYHLRGGR